VVYLIHFNAKLTGHARHYIGWTWDEKSLPRRIHHHRIGQGARIMAVVAERGIGFDVVRTWPEGDKFHERKLKNQKHAARLCPVCNPTGALRRAA